MYEKISDRGGVTAATASRPRARGRRRILVPLLSTLTAVGLALAGTSNGAIAAAPDDDSGAFSISTDVTGTATGLPDGLEFTGTATVTTPDGEDIEEDFATLIGETWTSADYPADSSVVVTGSTPSGPSNIEWNSFVIGPNTFDLTAGTVTPVTLSVYADVQLATFSATKQFSGTDEAQALIPDTAKFTVDYSYPADVTFDAGTGKFTISADGTAGTSPEIPVGAQLTLSERTADPVAGAVWGEPVITPSTVTIVEDSSISVTVENPITELFGGFSLTKSVSGSGAELVGDDATFTVDYSWEDERDRSDSGTLEVVAGGDAVAVADVPFGAVVTLTEGAPGPVPGVTWLDPVFSKNGFEITSEKPVAISLDNPTELATGTFSATATVSGDAAALVPEDAEFAVDYSYPAGPGFDAGSGSLTLGSERAATTSDPLPFGAQVTLDAPTPASVAGAVWGAATLTPTEFTVGAGTDTAVAVEFPIAEEIGDLTVAATVSGTGAALAADAEFDVELDWTASGDRSGSETLHLVAGAAAVAAADIPVGATVTLTQAAPAAITGLTWGEPVFSDNAVELVSGERTAITVDRPTQLGTGTLSVRKQIAGSAAEFVPADAEFTVHYAYPAGAGFAAGSGSLVVGADGAAVSGDPLPFGAVVSLTEATPEAVPNAEWTEAVFDAAEVTIGDGSVAEVVLTNTIVDTTPSPTPSPTAPTDPEPVLPPTTGPSADPGTDPAPPLAATGLDGSPLTVLGIAAILLLAGVLIAGLRRRSSRD